MKTKFRNSNKGFTIIEVLIVLAIAGLILAIVFLAVPQLQRNSRDNQRQNVGTRLAAELNTYSGNNQGSFPFTGITATTPAGAQLCTSIGVPKGCNDFWSRYVNPTGTPPGVNTVDPTTGNAMTLRVFISAAAGTIPVAQWQIGNPYLAAGSSCNGDASYTASTTSAANVASAKRFALFIPLDRSNTFYCVDNG